MLLTIKSGDFFIDGVYYGSSFKYCTGCGILHTLKDCTCVR